MFPGVIEGSKLIVLLTRTTLGFESFRTTEWFGLVVLFSRSFVGNRDKFSIGSRTPQILVAPFDKINRVEFELKKPASRDVVENESQAVIEVQERDGRRLELGAVRRVFQQHRVPEPGQRGLVALGVAADCRDEVDALDKEFVPVNCRPVRGEVIKLLSLIFVSLRGCFETPHALVALGITTNCRGEVGVLDGGFVPVNCRPVRGKVVKLLSVIFVSIQGCCFESLHARRCV